MSCEYSVKRSLALLSCLYMFNQQSFYLKTADNNIWYFMSERIQTLRQIKGVFSSLQFSDYCVLKG